MQESTYGHTYDMIGKYENVNTEVKIYNYLGYIG